jgi:hypothetical protein
MPVCLSCTQPGRCAFTFRQLYSANGDMKFETELLEPCVGQPRRSRPLPRVPPVNRSVTGAGNRKNDIRLCASTRCRTWMNNNVSPLRRRPVMDYATAAMEQMKLYCTDYPGSPSAVRRPRLLFRSDLWIALLGPNMEEGIVGIGPTVAAALRAFDVQYLAGLFPPAGRLGLR